MISSFSPLGSFLQFTGPASVSAYQSLLLSLTYSNSAPEPSPGNRSISLTLSDGMHRDMTAVIVVVILTNDSPLSLRADTTRLTFTEGDLAVSVGALSGVTLMDADREALVESLAVRLSGAREGGAEMLVMDATAVGGALESGDNITITRTSSLQSYQVRGRHILFRS